MFCAHLSNTVKKGTSAAFRFHCKNKWFSSKVCETIVKMHSKKAPEAAKNWGSSNVQNSLQKIMNLIEFDRKVNEFMVKTDVSRAPPNHCKNWYLSSKAPKMSQKAVCPDGPRMARNDGRGIRKRPSLGQKSAHTCTRAGSPSMRDVFVTPSKHYFQNYP